MAQTFDLLASMQEFLFRQQELFFKQLFALVTTKQFDLHDATLNACISVIDEIKASGP